MIGQSFKGLASEQGLPHGLDWPPENLEIGQIVLKDVSVLHHLNGVDNQVDEQAQSKELEYLLDQAVLNFAVEKEHFVGQVRVEMSNRMHAPEREAFIESLPPLCVDGFDGLSVAAVDGGLIGGILSPCPHHELKLPFFMDGHLGVEPGNFLGPGLLGREDVLMLLD